MATVAKIQAELDLDTGRFHGQVTSAIGGIKKFSSAVDQAGTQVNKTKAHVKGLGDSLRDTMIILGQFRAAMHTVWAFTGQWVGAIVEANAKLERMQVLMTGLSRAGTAAGKAADAIKDMNYVLDKAKNAPFAVDEIANSFVKLKASGIDPTKGSLDALMNAVAAFGGDDQTFHRATIAIQQMAGKGVISMEELRQQLGEAVPNAMQLMARATNMTMAELVKTISSGRLAAGPALEALFREMEMQYGGAASRMMDTWTGMVSRLKTQWLLFAKEIGQQGAFDAAKQGLQALTNFIGSAEGAAFAKDLGKALKEAVTLAIQLAHWLVENRDEIIKWGKIIAQVFVAKKLTDFSMGLAGTAVRIVEMARNLGGLTTAFAAARAGTMAWSAVIGAAAGPIGIAVTAIAGLISYLNAQKAAAQAAARAMDDYHQATSRGQAVSPEEQQAAQDRVALLLKVKKALRDYQNMDQTGINGYNNGKRREAVVGQVMDLLPQLREKGFITYNSTRFSDHVNSLTDQIGEFQKIIDEKWDEVSQDAGRQQGIQFGQQIERNIAGIGDKVQQAVDAALPKIGDSLSELGKKFDAGEISKPEYERARTAELTKVVKARVAGFQAARDSLAQQLAGMDKDSEGAKVAIRQIAEIDKRLESARAEMTSAMDPDSGVKLLPKMGSGQGAAKANPLKEYLETIIGKHAQLKAQLDDGNPTLEKFNAQLAAGAYGKNPDQGMVADIRKLLEANKQLADDVKKNNATEQLKQSLEELEAKASADVVSARLEATGDMYSQVSAGMVGFNRQIAVLGANLDKTKMSREDFDAWVTKIKENIAQVDMIGLQRFVADAEYQAYLDSLPKRARDLAELNKRLEENARMIAQFKANDPDKSKAAEYDALGARNEAAIRQQYANATKPAWQSLLDEWQDTTTQMDQMWANSMQRFTDTLVEAITTGKASFKDLATYVLKEIARILMSKAVAQLAQMVIGLFGGAMSSGSTGSGASNYSWASSSGFGGNYGSTGYGTSGSFGSYGFANGGIMTNKGPLPLNMYANGGVARSPQLALFGEGKKPEAYVPLPDGRSIPVSMEGGGGGINNQVGINITINQDGSASSDAKGNTESARQLGMLIDSRVKDTLVQESRPGGMLWQMKQGR